MVGLELCSACQNRQQRNSLEVFEAMALAAFDLPEDATEDDIEQLHIAYGFH